MLLMSNGHLDEGRRSCGGRVPVGELVAHVGRQDELHTDSKPKCEVIQMPSFVKVQ